MKIIKIPFGETRESFIDCKINQINRIKDLYDYLMNDLECFNQNGKKYLETTNDEIVRIQFYLEKLKNE